MYILFSIYLAPESEITVPTCILQDLPVVHNVQRAPRRAPALTLAVCDVTSHVEVMMCERETCACHYVRLYVPVREITVQFLAG